jgi:sortase (surface protein transpeptidase)
LVLFLLALAIAAPVQAQSIGAAPTLIDIPSIGAHAEVVPLGEDENGAMLAPTDPDTVGWYTLGTGIGAPGNALLDGHVDWAGRLRAFGLLGHLTPGDTIQITDTDGNVLHYSVTWTELFDASTAPLEQIFEQTPDEVVTLITCGGRFDPVAHMYVSRWVVRAARSEPIADGSPRARPGARRRRLRTACDRAARAVALH